jgi:hypothetical protein
MTDFATILRNSRRDERGDRLSALRSGGYSEAHIARTMAEYDARDPELLTMAVRPVVRPLVAMAGLLVPVATVRALVALAATGAMSL